MSYLWQSPKNWKTWKMKILNSKCLKRFLSINWVSLTKRKNLVIFKVLWKKFKKKPLLLSKSIKKSKQFLMKLIRSQRIRRLKEKQLNRQKCFKRLLNKENCCVKKNIWPSTAPQPFSFEMMPLTLINYI